MPPLALAPPLPSPFEELASEQPTTAARASPAPPRHHRLRRGREFIGIGMHFRNGRDLLDPQDCSRLAELLSLSIDDRKLVSPGATRNGNRGRIAGRLRHRGTGGEGRSAGWREP